MSTSQLSLLCLVVALFYSTTLIDTVNGNCPEDCPLPRSCKDWYDLGIRKSCYYPIYLNGDIITHQLVYCDMKGTQCDGKGGWTRVGYLNMTQSDATCPTGLTQRSFNNINHDLCGRRNVRGAGCSSTEFSSSGVRYSKVCGQVRGYAYSSPDSFQQLSVGIDSYYVDGVSITHGRDPRQHIWTFAAGNVEDNTNVWACPCNTGYTGGKDPTSTFVGDHYYCESGLAAGQPWKAVFHATDPLWDGKQCNSNEAPCCPTNSKMPWFYRLLDEKTQDDIELRVCSNQGYSDEGTPLDIIELYIQ